MTTPITPELLLFWQRKPRRRYLDGALFVIQRRRRLRADEQRLGAGDKRM